MDAGTLLVQILLVIAVPLLVGLSIGADRKLTARIQNRIGPPIVQPFYDVIKLLGKSPMYINRLQVFFAGASLIFQTAAFILFVAGGDLLISFFISGTGSIFLVMGAFSTRSPYSHIGGQRELLTIFAYETVLFLVVLSIGLVSNTFLVKDIGGGLYVLPLVLASLVPVLIILADKSPYDIATAHQEIISGPYIEYSGPYLALLQVARWFQLAFIFGLFTLFVWSPDPLLSGAIKVIVAGLALVAAIIIDNITARLTRGRMVRFMLSIGVGLIALNLLALFIYQGGAL
jgi:ech hydrogenase subunit B